MRGLYQLVSVWPRVSKARLGRHVGAFKFFIINKWPKNFVLHPNQDAKKQEEVPFQVSWGNQQNLD